MTKISIITVCYNAIDTLPETIDSIVQQSYDDIEHVVIDGGSTDWSLEYFRANAPRSLVESGPDRGIYDAMNKGVARATGDAFIFMNAGDFFYSRYSVEMAVDFLDRNPAVDVAYGGIEVRAQDGGRSVFMPNAEDGHLDFLITRSLPHQATFARRRAFAVAGLFDHRYRSHGDYDWFLRIAGDERLRMTEMPFLVASFAAGGISSDLERGERERHRIQNGFAPYCRPEWMKKRIDAYQELYLGMRLATEGR